MPTNTMHTSRRQRGVASATNDATKTEVADPGLILTGAIQWAHQISTFHAAWQQEWLGFVSQRLSKDADFMQRLASCKGPEQVARTYAEFFKQTIDDYQNELATLAQLGAEMTVAAVPVAANGHDVLAPNELEIHGKLKA